MQSKQLYTIIEIVVEFNKSLLKFTKHNHINVFAIYHITKVTEMNDFFRYTIEGWLFLVLVVFGLLDIRNGLIEIVSTILIFPNMVLINNGRHLNDIS